MASRFIKPRDEMIESCRKAGRKRASQQKIDKAFGWRQHTRVKTRLSVRRASEDHDAN